MVYKTFYHQLESGEAAKFTISEKIIKGKTYYYANVINTDLEFYKDLSDFEKDSYLGVEVSNGRQSTIYYKSPQKLENDIKQYYGKKWLESEI
ncbi:MAG: hypothetical protein PF436_09285 [Prolixibacteraceae bacterium]|jgi:hypothetical protein|nr:hypothetical protein [Prolixibacteraceae bacterium]